MKKHIVSEGEVVTIGLDDYRALKAIEAAFTKNLLAAEGGNDAYQKFRKNARLDEMFALAARRLKWKQQDARGLKGKPPEQAGAIARYCNTAVAPLRRSFGEAALISALPEQARADRTIQVCRALGAEALAQLCERAKNTPPKA